VTKSPFPIAFPFLPGNQSCFRPPLLYPTLSVCCGRFFRVFGALHHAGLRLLRRRSPSFIFWILSPLDWFPPPRPPFPLHFPNFVVSLLLELVEVQPLMRFRWPTNNISSPFFSLLHSCLSRGTACPSAFPSIVERCFWSFWFFFWFLRGFLRRLLPSLLFPPVNLLFFC